MNNSSLKTCLRARITKVDLERQLKGAVSSVPPESLKLTKEKQVQTSDLQINKVTDVTARLPVQPEQVRRPFFAIYFKSGYTAITQVIYNHK